MSPDQLAPIMILSCIGMLFAAYRFGMSRAQAPGSRDVVDAIRHELADADRRRAHADGALASRLHSLERSASQLAGALHTPKVRGRWGELHLRRAVEAAGMLAHCDFVEQGVFVSGDDDVRRQPDMVIRLAGGKSIVVDAKAPMDSWLAALDTDDESERETLERGHAAAVRGHVRALASKRYADVIPGALSLVVLYLPGEDLLRAALEHDAALLEFASGVHVAIATPATLVGMLHGVSHGWRDTVVNEHAARISELGALVHDRIGVVNDHLARAGRALDTSVRAYDDAVSSLHARLIPAARDLRALQVPTSRNLDPAERVDRSPRVRSIG